jgi:spore germination cell wall hydrolase CwlJ-like protein
LNEEFRCLAQNVYWEARSEPELGKIAVAKVTLNRVASGGFPSTICGVVRQGGSKVRSRCQFSWYCDGKSDEPDEAEAWHKAQQIASQALFYTIEDPTGGALWFHATYVRPAWAHSKVVTLRVGRHIYYASRVMPRPGRP